MESKGSGQPIICRRCHDERADECLYCEGTGQQWLYPRGAVARSYMGFLDGKMSRMALKSLARSRGSRRERRAQSAARRKYERNRLKFDRTVEPQGPKPKKRERVAILPERKKVFAPAAPVSDEPALVDIHHDDRETKVLYEMDELRGEFNFRDTILDQIERYFVYLDRMRKNDSDAWALYRQVGAVLVPYASIGNIAADLWFGDEKPEKYNNNPVYASDWFREKLPAFGCVACGANPYIEQMEQDESKYDGDKERWLPKFLYFRKYRIPPVNMQLLPDCAIYTLTIWWDKPYNRKHARKIGKWGVPQEIGVAVRRTGEIVALKSLETRLITPKGARHSFPQRRWIVPSEFRQFAKNCKLSTNSLVGRLFEAGAKAVENSAHAMIQVSASKDGRHAMFNVDALRMPYFFRDRDYVLTETGYRKPIFHIVRPHERRDGSAVRKHFRGQRRFTWAGYEIHITVPGRDHSPVGEYQGGAYDLDAMGEKSKPSDMISSGEVGERIRNYIGR